MAAICFTGRIPMNERDTSEAMRELAPIPLLERAPIIEGAFRFRMVSVCSATSIEGT